MTHPLPTLARALAAGALATTLAAPAWGQTVMTQNFDALTCNFAGGTVGPNNTPVPNGTGGLDWDNVLCVDGPGVVTAWGPNGYGAGTTSTPNVAFGAADPLATLTRSGGGLFSLHSAQLTAGWHDNMTITIEGFVGATSVATVTVYPLADAPTLADLSALANVDRVVFTPSGGTPHPGYDGSGEYFALDDLSYSLAPRPAAPAVAAVPTLGEWGLLLTGLLAAGLGLRRLRRRA